MIASNVEISSKYITNYMNDKDFESLLYNIFHKHFTHSSLEITRDPELNTGIKLAGSHILKLAEVLKNNPHITTINLSYNDIKDEGAVVLSAISTLVDIDLTGNRITATGANYFGRSNITRLSLAENNIHFKNSNTDKINFQDMVESFCKNTSITELDLSFCTIPSKMIAQLIRYNTTIQVLKSSRDLTDEALEFIEINTTIKELYISKNTLTDRSAHNIYKNKSLLKLHIEYSSIGDKGVAYLSQHFSIQTLIIRDSNITVEGTKSFYKGSITEVTIFNTVKHKFISNAELVKFKAEFKHVADNQLKKEQDYYMELKERLECIGSEPDMPDMNDIKAIKKSINSMQDQLISEFMEEQISTSDQHSIHLSGAD